MSKRKIILLIIFTNLLIFFYVFYSIYLKKVNNDNDIIIEIPKNSSLMEISIILENQHLTSSKYYPFFYSLLLNYDKNLSFGEYLITNQDTLYSTIKKIKNGKIYYRKFLIIEGFEKYHLINLIKNSSLKKNNYDINNYKIIADTFTYYKNQNVISLLEKINNYTINLFKYYESSDILKEFNIEEILIISSLVEKEGKTETDKRLISSVIFNRLRDNMKLDIDATVIYSITNGDYKYEKKLNYQDLKINNRYNTYIYKGLPPGIICYPGTKTVKIVLENYKSPYYYYFYNENINSHIFSINYKEHLNKLNEYREKNKT